MNMILNYHGDDDLLHVCKVLLSFLSANAVLPNSRNTYFKGHLSLVPLEYKIFDTVNFNCDKYFEVLIDPMEESWFYVRLLYEVAVVITKGKKLQYKGYQ